MATVLQVGEGSLRRAARIVREGGVIVVPTDTVYGIACDPFNESAAERIYEVKRRERSKALQVLMSSLGDLRALGLELPPPLDVLSAGFLPGPFSPIAVAGADCALVTPKREADGSRTQAIRIPDSDVALRVLRATGPLAASSANRSGERSAQSVEEAQASLGDDVDLYLDGGPTASHVASTVVAADSDGADGVVVLREGVIPAVEIREALRRAAGSRTAHATRGPDA
ncbi:L-threonylcarbamoyladenylate synthase [uncultured Bifidobacterium sp.]|uniref:L-threonylcarbamoyladenylate synthase n=1 Tax=uncultured Bifidobacterium sp. TaxID=165187 RepID=UPI0028DBF645|nr:L-threonylcarbamoyladenylate synthase [uncultured Bifidobacterium sp.]